MTCLQRKTHNFYHHYFNAKLINLRETVVSLSYFYLESMVLHLI